MGFLVPVVKVVGAFLAKAAVKVAVAAVVSKVATKAISKLVAKRANTEAPSGADGGGRVQLPPASDNKLPVIYGTAWATGPVVDAKISADQKYMWYVIALCEKTDSGTISFDLTDGVYYDGKRVNFGTNGAVASLITNTTPPQNDTRVANKIYIWLFNNGSSSGINTGGQTAIQIMSDSVTGGGIPADLRWNSALYTSGGQSASMNNTAFAIVRVEYNVDAGTTGLGTLQIKVTNNLGADNGARPGDAIFDYMTNERYGCGISTDLIDVASLTALNNYSNDYITYIPQGGGYAQQRRYRINGPLDTSNTCLNNLQFLVDSCDSWLQYTETTGKWRIVMNAPYNGTPFLINSSNMIGGLQINPLDLNDTYNQVEVAYPNTNVRDQTDYQIVDLTDPTTDWYPLYNGVLSPNEATNRLNVVLPLVNNAVQAKYLAVRRLLQSREDLVISCNLDYSGIQIDAGDVIRVTHEAYGWTDKLFRVSQVNEVQDENGNLGASIEAFEYNAAIYSDNAIQDFVPSNNTGLRDPNVISPPCVPTITPFNDANALITGFTVCSCVPEEGTVLYMDFNYGTTSNVLEHQLYRTVQSAGGLPFTPSANIANGNVNTICINVNDLPANTYYWSATARNDQAGRYSGGTGAYTWGGANIQPFDPGTGNGGLPPNVYRPNSIPASAISGGSLSVYDTNGNLVSGGVDIIQFSNMPVTLLAPGAVQVTKLGYSNIPLIGSYYYSINNNFANTTTLPVNITTFGANVKTANFMVPKYINGADPGSSYIWPYAQGTSNTAAGYIQNSTAAFQPALAAVFNIQNGNVGWYVLDYKPLGFTVPSGSTIQYAYEATLYANVDANVQILNFVTTTANTVQIVADTGAFLSQHEVPANIPYNINITQSILNDLTYDGAGILIRNITPNSNVAAVQAAFGVVWALA